MTTNNDFKTKLTEEQVEQVKQIIERTSHLHCWAKDLNWDALGTDGKIAFTGNNETLFNGVQRKLLRSGYEVENIECAEEGKLMLTISPTPLRKRYERAEQDAKMAEKYRRWWSDSEDEISELKRQIKSLMEIGGMDECHSDPKVATISKAIELLLR